jgi:hypothetical protein
MASETGGTKKLSSFAPGLFIDARDRDALQDAVNPRVCSGASEYLGQRGRGSDHIVVPLVGRLHERADSRVAGREFNDALGIENQGAVCYSS